MTLRAFRLLKDRRGLAFYAAGPLLGALLLYTILVALAVYGLRHWDWGAYHFEFFGEFLSGWIAEALNLSKWLVVIPAMLAAVYFTFTAVGLLLAGPVNDVLSKKVELAVCEPPPNTTPSGGAWWSGTLLALLDAGVLVLQQIFWTVLVLPLLLLPVAGWVPFFLVSAYFTGRGCFEAPAWRNFLRRRHIHPATRARRWEILGLGVALQLLFLIPLAGLLVLPLGVTAGTLLYCEVDWGDIWQGENLPPPAGFQAPDLRPES